MYPLLFNPPFKDYIWGGRNLEKLGKKLPETGIVAESWEISCHPDGESIIDNGELKGKSLSSLIAENPERVLGRRLTVEGITEFPILVKLIDANDKLSVQVHPGDEYAQRVENCRYGKTEMWYVLSCREGAQLVYDVMPGITKEDFSKAVEENNIGRCLKSIPVAPGDIINIPAGVVHAIGDGIVLAEVQQSSNLTYRVYDYDRVDKDGKGRPLHIEKALDVIDFNSQGRKDKSTGLAIKSENSTRTIHIVNEYFAVELINVNGSFETDTEKQSFHAYYVSEGSLEVVAKGQSITIEAGQTFLVPADLGAYTLQGSFTVLKAYIPDLAKDIKIPLLQAGFSLQQIIEGISGLTAEQKQLLTK